MAYERTYNRCSLRMKVDCNDANGDPLYLADGETRKVRNTTFQYLKPTAADAAIMAAYSALAGLQIHAAQNPAMLTEIFIETVS